MGGREVPFAERGVLDDIKAKQLGYGEKPDYIGVAATLNFVRSEKLWYEACASEGCQKKVVQNTDGTWMRARGVLSCFHVLGWTRGHRTTPGVVSSSILSCFGPRRGRRGVSERQRSRRWRLRDHAAAMASALRHVAVALSMWL